MILDGEIEQPALLTKLLEVGNNLAAGCNSRDVVFGSERAVALLGKTCCYDSVGLARRCQAAALYRGHRLNMRRLYGD